MSSGTESVHQVESPDPISVLDRKTGNLTVCLQHLRLENRKDYRLDLQPDPMMMRWIPD